MNKKIIFALIGFAFFNQMASADVVTPGQQPHAPIRHIDHQAYSWSNGPFLIAGSQGCGSPNICTGDYEIIVQGYNGPVRTAGGVAFCNSVGNGCPSAKECIADEALKIVRNPPLREINYENSPRSGSVNSGNN